MENEQIITCPRCRGKKREGYYSPWDGSTTVMYYDPDRYHGTCRICRGQEKLR